MVTMEEIRELFFDAMEKGYANPKAQKKTIAALPRSKMTLHQKDDLMLIDIWFTTNWSNKSFGSTIIFYKKNPVWFMCYAGEYKPEAIPFLKQVLHHSYSRKKWHGGRGVPSYHDANLHYANNQNRSGFEDFNGKESIYKMQESLGWHRYWGMSLL